VLSTASLPKFGENSRPFPCHARTNAPALSLCGCRLCRHARTHSYVDQRTGGGESFRGDAGRETAHGAGAVAEEEETRSAATRFVWGGTAAGVLAGRFYDFNVWTSKKGWRNCGTCTATPLDLDWWNRRSNGGGAAIGTVLWESRDWCGWMWGGERFLFGIEWRELVKQNLIAFGNRGTHPSQTARRVGHPHLG